MVKATPERVYNWIDSYIKTNGRPPTYREIAHGFDIAYSHAFYHVKLLRKNGLLDVIDGAARSIALVDRPSVDHDIYALAWAVVDAWDDGGLGETIRRLRAHLERTAPRKL
jgi:SOS-response transcriptional repressor LexA